MTFRAKLLASATMLALAGLVPNHARAGLLGAGNTVQAFYTPTLREPERIACQTGRSGFC
jgi:hypothetical protein